jgi:hypothetical protein
MEKLNQSLTDGVLTEHFWDDLEGKLVTKTTQDIEPSVEYAKALGNDEGYFRDGVKKNFAHAGHIPAEVCVELLKIGVNVYRAETSLAQIRAGLRKLGKEGFIWGS